MQERANVVKTAVSSIQVVSAGTYDGKFAAFEEGAINRKIAIRFVKK